MLADKVSGTMVGVWLLAAEHLRLGTWDLLCAWTGKGSRAVEPRLALQAVHESAMCVARARRDYTLTQKGFEGANGLPFLATDQAMHDLFEARSVEETKQLQVNLGRLRRAAGHFKGRLLALDPHLLRSWSKRWMRRHRHKRNEQAVKATQTFFCLDAESLQPVAFTLGGASKTVAQATPELLDMAQEILNPRPGQTLAMADGEHLSTELFRYVNERSAFDFLCPMARGARAQKELARIPDEMFKPRWAGMATAVLPYRFTQAEAGPLYQLIQRDGETAASYHYSAFLSTTDRDEVRQLTEDFPARWRIEEFFNAYQAMGWNRAGTQNLNVRYAQLSMALVAQAVVDQLRRRLGPPYERWEAGHLGKDLFRGLDGDVRVRDDTILVTFYNAPNAKRLRHHYERLPAKLEAEGVDPRLPWLYDFKLDFCFK